jgi:hypothetical protein
MMMVFEKLNLLEIKKVYIINRNEKYLLFFIEPF